MRLYGYICQSVIHGKKPRDILREGVLDEDSELDPWALLREKDRRIAEKSAKLNESSQRLHVFLFGMNNNPNRNALNNATTRAMKKGNPERRCSIDQ